MLASSRVPAQAVTTFGRYELLVRLARGGMAELFLARLRGIGGFARLVAIKRILPHLSEDPPFVQMFLNEGRIAAQLAHPNVCQVHEIGEVDGQLFLVMEYLAGVAWSELAAAIPQRQRQTLRIAASVIGQACDGLHYAHEHDVVHRDVSPQNLFVTVDGACKVLDFGVSKMVSDVNRTRSGLIKGKLPYMPPEQLKGEPVDARADVFAMGVVLWEALTGERLFLRANDYLIWKAISEEPIPPVSKYCADYGPAVDRVVGHALERDRELRFPTIRAFADELRYVTSAIGGPATPGELAEIVKWTCAPQLEARRRQVAVAAEVTPLEDTHEDVTAASVTHSVQLRDESVALGRRRKRWFGIAIGIMAIGAAGVGIAAILARIDAPPQPLPEPLVTTRIDPPSGDAEIEMDPSDPDVASDAPTSPAPAPHVRRVQPPGFFSIDSNPYATIFIDGKRRDQTPLFRIVLPSGRHRVRAVLADGRERTFQIQIAPGKEVSSGTLTW